MREHHPRRLDGRKGTDYNVDSIPGSCEMGVGSFAGAVELSRQAGGSKGHNTWFPYPRSAQGETGEWASARRDDLMSDGSKSHDRAVNKFAT